MTLQMQLNIPLVEAMVQLLETNLNATIDEVNADYDDRWTVDHVVQFLDYVPPPSALQGGLPAVGIQDLPSRFQDDLQFNVDAEHRYAIVITIQNSDHGHLVKQLRRTMQAIGLTIQADRLATPSIMRTTGTAWSVEFGQTVPGPLLGDIDPVNPDRPPRTYLSWMALELSSKRQEAG